MKARSVLAGDALSKDTLRVAKDAFDAAWTAVAHEFKAKEREEARRKLAHAVLIVANDESSNAKSLRTMALRLLLITANASVLDRKRQKR